MAKFRARARTVDLLGRQQINGIPTAIHELFKNAYDAYSKHVDVDYFREDKLFVLRDDGVGMTKADFIDRWLVVGTESKIKGARSLSRPAVDASMAPRPVLGQKGIGRLAVGIVGKQLLVLSRAKRDGKMQPLVAAFTHWDVFSLPGVDLSEIDIPIREVSAGEPVDADLVASLVAEFRASIKSLSDRGRIEGLVADEIFSDLDMFTLDPFAMESWLGGAESLRLSNGGPGTQFWIGPAADILKDELEAPKNKPSRIEKQLLGFANTMTPGAPEPAMQTSFRDHHSSVDVRELITASKFFSPSDFKNADHSISGAFDEKGNFKGTVSVYGERYEGYVAAYHGAKPTCGPFRFDLGYVQGAVRETTLPDEEWRAFRAKAGLFGGVYVYYDGTRVLPYGNLDHDWLEIEERRSRHAGYYFYSHRLMCGAVQLSSQDNPKLQAKAGREGFIRTRPYRDVVSVINNLLLRTAHEFFAKGTRWEEKRNELQRGAAARKRRKSQIAPLKKKFDADLDQFFENVETHDLRETVSRIVGETRSRVLARLEQGTVPELVEIVEGAQVEFRQLVAGYTVSKPRIELSQSRERRYRQYLNQRSHIVDTIMAPNEEALDELLTAALEGKSRDPQYAARLREGVDEPLSTARSEIAVALRNLEKTADACSTNLKAEARSRATDARNELSQIEVSVEDLARLVDSDASFRESRTRLLSRIDSTRAVASRFGAMEDQLGSLSWSDEDNVLEQLVAVAQESEHLRERLDDDLESANLGKAVEILSHEFDHVLTAAHLQLRHLDKWGKKNAALGVLTRDLRSSFEHIDGYLSLFVPLQRRLRRSKTTFNGADISEYLHRLFGKRLTEQQTTLKTTKAFANTEVHGLPSVYYPVFVNLVDNAIWWVRDQPERVITLDAGAQYLSVGDTGPGISETDADAVFSRGFSLKDGGRGLGLTISRDAMRRIGGDVALLSSERGTTFEVRLPGDTSDKI